MLLKLITLYTCAPLDMIVCLVYFSQLWLALYGGKRSSAGLALEKRSLLNAHDDTIREVSKSALYNTTPSMLAFSMGNLCHGIS